ncbi:MAG TPA: hypothetical protein VKR83_04660 [Ktedonobacteraceae bacterium]|nr:hypothetical protein [Ktedonobacteraceae bacterium]
MSIETTRTDVRLQGWMLSVARATWLAFALLTLVLLSINLFQPLFGRQAIICPLTFTCPYDASTLQALQHAHISLTAYTSYATAFGLLSALIFVGLSVLIFWRMFDQVTGLFASFSFLFIGAVTLVADFSRMPLALQVFENDIQPLFMFFCLGFFLVTFPDGRFVPRWGWLIGCTLFVQAIFFIIPGPFNILSWPLPLSAFELVLAYGSPIVVQIYRYRRVSTPAQRQQTRWVIFGLVCFLLVFLLTAFTGVLIPTVGVVGSLSYLASISLQALALLLIPLSITIAILRSRLWNIDVIINRTLVYGSLTALLVLLYVGLIFVLQSLLGAIIKQSNNDVAIVISTLVIAALFQPLRKRIQNIIDRRFYRRKYDAAKVVAAFSATLRQEVDLDQLHAHLLEVVQETMQPNHVSLWLRPPEHDGTQRAPWRSAPPVSSEGK